LKRGKTLEVFYEVSSIALTVKGKGENKKGDEINKTYLLENLDMLIEKAKSNYIDFKTSVKSFDKSFSKRYQSIGIEKIKVHQEDNGIKYYHLALHYIFREKGNLRLADIKDGFAVRKVETTDGEFLSNYLHLTIVPSFNTLIVDRRCNSTPTEEYLRQLFIPLIDHTQFGLSHLEELQNNTKVKIRQELVKDYQKRLKESFAHLKNISFTLSKPLSERSKKKKSLKDSVTALNSVKSIIQNVLGEDAVTKSLIDSPIKTIQVSVTLDSSYNSKQLKEIRKTAKDNILNYINNDFLTASCLEFKDEKTDQVFKALLRGIGKNHKFDLDAGKLEDDIHIWNIHRQIFQNELSGTQES
jgi:hypothetical protein